MAVEAHHLNPFPSQLLGNRDIIGSVQPSMNPYNAQMNAYNSSLLPLSGSTTATDAPLLPAPYNSFIVDSLPQKTPIKSDSVLSHNLPSVCRKRSRDSINYPLLSYKNTTNNDNGSPAFSFLGQDISLQIHQHQLDIDRLIAHHMESMRVDLEEKRKRQERRILEAIEVGMMKRLRAKEEEIAKIGKLNWALEEKVKSLCVENQIWRDLAQTNEANANALRSNLEQVLAHPFKEERRLNEDDGAAVVPAGAEIMDDAQSCCGSTGGVDVDDLRDEGGNDGEDMEGWRRLGGVAKDKEEEEGKRRRNGVNKSSLCRKCGKEESCVLILPCRHLCLCTVCGLSSLNTCPICKSFKTGSVHVNMS